jgi:GNAT superfamily N-acetyltransferase
MPEQKQILIRQAKVSDIDFLVEVHSKSLPRDVFVNLGRRFLTNFYQVSFYRKDLQIYVAEYQNRVSGFLVFSMGNYSILSYLKPVMYYMIGWNCIKNPKLLVLIFKQLLNLKSTTQPEIVFFAVLPEFQGKGMGTQLLNKVIYSLKRKNFKKMITKTSNKKLAIYYINNYGAKVIHHFQVLDQIYNILQWDI